MNNKECCLIVIFNHRYDKNIIKIRNLYKDKFDDIFIVMPFYDGEIVDGVKIITVYESSYYFSGYIAQAYEKIKLTNLYNHYVIIGDDLLLNPKFNQDNLCSELGLSLEMSYIKAITPIYESNGISSKRFYDSILLPFYNYDGIEWKKEIIKNTEAFQITNYKKKLSIKWLISQIMIGDVTFKKIIGRTIYILKDLLLMKGLTLPYPLYKDYSDFLILSGSDMDKLCHYFGVFASMNIFVEVAIPTIMKLLCSKIITENDIYYRGVEYWTEKEKTAFEVLYDCSLNRLFDNWDEQVLYYHPIKLSKWK